MVEHRTALRVARDMSAILGWDTVQARLTPHLVQVRHGDFGEMLATEILVDFGGLIVPVRKVRYQIHADQTQIGADVVGLEIVDGRVASVHFAEVKFRSTGDTAAADSAHEQLSTWHSSEFAQIVFFVGARLEESNPGLYEIFFEYLRDATVRVDQFHIILVWEAASWSDTVLSNLPQPPDLLEPLTVRVVLIEGLVDLSDRAYQGMAALVDL